MAFQEQEFQVKGANYLHSKINKKTYTMNAPIMKARDTNGRRLEKQLKYRSSKDK